MHRRSSRILLDHNTPATLRRFLPGHEVYTTADQGWSELTNGELLTAVEKPDFVCLITADQNIRYQQNLASRQIALVVLSTNIWPTVLPHAAMILAAVGRVASGKL